MTKLAKDSAEALAALDALDTIRPVVTALVLFGDGGCDYHSLTDKLLHAGRIADGIALCEMLKDRLGIILDAAVDARPKSPIQELLGRPIQRRKPIDRGADPADESSEPG